ncbi:unnamed protein product [Dovyalis caffra]|uniref:Uncharacterized protein n=1 Tax=Dovyalis caffra TaxID=77055 RepID=A0AAV1RSB1_9ROSI|nr:unnamed protein product [Dovyalis caffra]
MASSSHTTHNDYDYSCPVEEGERERDWLELGLGLGISRITTTTTCRKQEHNTEQSNTTSSFEASSLVQFEAHQQIGHSLRLELGLRIVEFDNNDGSGGVRRDKDVAPLSNYNKSSKWQDNQGQEGHDHNLDLTARSSSQSWPWHRISRTSTSSLKWKKPVSNDSHNCSTAAAAATTTSSSIFFNINNYKTPLS